MKCIFMYNPNSGHGTTKRHLSKILDGLKTKYDVVDIYATEKAHDMETKVREIVAQKLYDLIVFSGGDGTFNEVVSGIGDCQDAPSLGYIPGGTCNDIARTFKIPKGVRRAIGNVLEGREMAVDCMKINDRYSMYVTCAGALTSATYTTPQSQKKILGKLAYVIEGVKKNLKFDAFNVKIDNGEEILETECMLIMVINGESIAGFNVNTSSSQTDGRAEVALFKQKKNPKFRNFIVSYLMLAKFFFFGYRFKQPTLLTMSGSHFKIETDENVVWNFDGEKGVEGNIDLTVLPQHIKIIVPVKYFKKTARAEKRLKKANGRRQA